MPIPRLVVELEQEIADIRNALIAILLAMSESLTVVQHAAFLDILRRMAEETDDPVLSRLARLAVSAVERK